MKIWYSPYQLYPLGSLNRFNKKIRSGFLIKIQTRDIKAGYADCHPLVEFGDEPIEILLKKLKAQKLTSLLKRSLHFAKIDGLAREKEKSLFSLIKIKSHYTCSDVKTITDKKIEKIAAQGFTTIKVKVGKNILLETRVLNAISKNTRSLLQWRFDANGGDGQQFLKLLNKDFYELTDFIEDPMPFNNRQWRSLSKTYSVSCAFDQPVGIKAKSVYKGIRVLKPARQAVSPRKIDIITNSMDHPVGQSFALWAAQTTIQKLGKQPQDYGLQTAHLFKTNNFFEEIKTPNSYFKVSDGHGVGFNKLLEKTKWQSL